MTRRFSPNPEDTGSGKASRRRLSGFRIRPPFPSIAFTVVLFLQVSFVPLSSAQEIQSVRASNAGLDDPGVEPVGNDGHFQSEVSLEAAPRGPSLRPAQPRDLVRQTPDRSVDALLLRGQRTIALSTLVDEIVDDLVHDLGNLDESLISPIAIRAVEVSPNLKATFARDLESRIIAAVAQSTDIAQVHCAACRAMRSRVEGDSWVITLGPVSQDDLRRLGKSLGVTSFLEVDFAYGSGVNSVSLTARLVRASDGHLLWAESYVSDSTTAALLRGRERKKSRDERRAELQRLIEGRPYYGQAAFVGTAIIPWDHPIQGFLSGVTGGYRLFERFGPERSSLFGVQLEGFMNLEAPLFGGFVSALFLQEISVKSLHLPEVRVGGALGGFLVGTEGNSFYGEVVAEAMLKFRFGISASVFYMVPAQYLSYDLGGVGAKARLTFNW